jgi:adenylate cyclase
MESHGLAGCIQVTARTYELLKHRYRFERRGPIHVKGKEEMVTYFLVAKRNDSADRLPSAGYTAPA